MKKIIETTKIVRELLENIPATRDDDNLLWWKTLEITGNFYEIPVGKLTVEYVLTRIYEMRLPTFETVSRARRKLQEKYPHLKGSEGARKRRREKELLFEEYARNG